MTVKLTSEEAIDMAVSGTLRVKGKTYFRKKRFDDILHVNQNINPGEIMTETRTAVFVLSPNQN